LPIVEVVETVFAAVADPTRRQILEVLRRSGPSSLTELAAPLPMSRQAVTKHLDLLRQSGLVRVERRGRERLHHLVTEPLREMEDWLKPYAELWDERLERLRRHLKEKKG
jgi:DNA-binding transcriptional ArsR family regulator